MDQGNMEKLEEAKLRIIDVTEDYVSSELPSHFLPHFTAILGPFIINLYFL